MTQGFYRIRANTPLAAGVFRLILEGDTAAITAPGQFVNLRLDGLFLRRPLSVCDWDGETLTLIYKVVGTGTRLLASLLPGATLDLLVGLGNGYDMSDCGAAPLLIGGGVGVPPLYGLAKRLAGQGKAVRAILGYNTAADVFYESEFAALCESMTVTTADGSYGRRGFVTDALSGVMYTYFYTCGPEPMLHAVDMAATADGQFSFEERMGCGFGACMGCSCQTKYGSKRICKDGPVLRREEIVW